jgi:hypothetical protein
MSSKILSISLRAYSVKSLFSCPMNSVICKNDQWKGWCRNSRTVAGKCILHTNQAGFGNSDAVDFYLESIRFRSQLLCSAILTSFPRLSLFHGWTLPAGSPTHKNVSSTILLSLLGTRNNLLISFETVTFWGESMSLNIPRLNNCINRTSSDVCILKQATQWKFLIWTVRRISLIYFYLFSLRILFLCYCLFLLCECWNISKWFKSYYNIITLEYFDFVTFRVQIFVLVYA